MKFHNILKAFAAAGLLISLLSGCSGGTTAGGLGLSVGGTWFGTLARNNVAYASFSMGLSQAADDTNDPFSGNTLVGVFSSNNNCIGGGALTGTLSGNSINITATTANGSIILTGSSNNSSMGGSWFNTGTVSETETVGETTTTTVAETCNLGGTWNASR